MRRSIHLAILASLLLLTGPAFADEPPTKPFEPKEGHVNVPFGGFVTEVTKDSITIQLAPDGASPRRPYFFPSTRSTTRHPRTCGLGPRQ
jgi:hypothetical protein